MPDGGPGGPETSGTPEPPEAAAEVPGPGAGSPDTAAAVSSAPTESTASAEEAPQPAASRGRRGRRRAAPASPQDPVAADAPAGAETGPAGPVGDGSSPEAAEGPDAPVAVAVAVAVAGPGAEETGAEERPVKIAAGTGRRRRVARAAAAEPGHGQPKDGATEAVQPLPETDPAPEAGETAPAATPEAESAAAPRGPESADDAAAPADTAVESATQAAQPSDAAQEAAVETIAQEAQEAQEAQAAPADCGPTPGDTPGAQPADAASAAGDASATAPADAGSGPAAGEAALPPGGQPEAGGAAASGEPAAGPGTGAEAESGAGADAADAQADGPDTAPSAPEANTPAPAPENAAPDAAELNAAQPDAAEPGAVEPDTAGSGTAEPEAAQPGTVEPDAAQPGAAAPGAVEPDTAGSGTAEPEAAQPGTVEPDEAQPGTVESNAAQPDAAAPGAAQLDAAELGTELDAAQPGAAGPDEAQPGTAAPDAAEPGTAELDVAQPGTAEPDAAEPGTDESNAAEPGTAQPDGVEPHAVQADTTGPDMPGARTEEPGAAGSRAELAEPSAAETGAETADPAAAGPDVAEPTAADPGAAEPTAAEPEAVEPGAAEQPVTELPDSEPEAAPAGPAADGAAEPAPEDGTPATEPASEPAVSGPTGAGSSAPGSSEPGPAAAAAEMTTPGPHPATAETGLITTPAPATVPSPAATPTGATPISDADLAPDPGIALADRLLSARSAPRAGAPASAPDADAAPAASPEAAASTERPDESAPSGEPDRSGGTAQPAPLSGPPAPGFGDAEREAVLRVMRERRDIRNGFRKDPVPHDVLLRVLEAAHHAPSVGHSQPWDFVVIRSAETRRAMHELAVRQREAYAKSLPKARAKQFKELKIEAILDTPVNIVVTADPTRGGRHTLGRHTQPQMAPYSSALAVENLWLAARAEGLGVGWVSFFDEREMVRVLGLPEHLEVVAYLCVGYVDEFPAEPELAQAGWSKRRPLSWVVHEETYGRRALPGEEPHDLLAETLQGIRPLDAKALGEAWERQKRMTKPAGALGMLEIISAQLSGLSRKCPPPIPEPAVVAIFAGDHGVHAQGVTPWPQEVTAQMVANFLGGGAVCNAFARQIGAEVCVIDVGVTGDLPATPGLLPRKIRAGTGDFTAGPALEREEVLRAIEVGIETARDLVAAGNKALLTGEMGIANTTVSAALISVFTEKDPAEVTGRGTGISDETHARKVEVVRRGLELHRPDPEDPIGVLAAVGGLEHAALVGLILGGASLRTPVILDGVSAGAAALAARAIAPESLAACIAGHRSAEPGHVAALTKLGLRPLIDLDLRLGEGTGALLALPVVQSAARAMHEVATFDSAGVTEKS
ncbi:nicotinate-nucleotide--dimethylbenzimidazole phosphoribosyltransferase [Streptomyces albus]|uniref:nicotinate-nucleotide--dimethylbenzimidazole phosphoribosyltransferase n=1 Tax=Streptomyces albus TaxID=1888 RepID=UPI001FCA495A|nr:nicotinate-nucleotide--dimethylbenzimidazole phosphoribosyltransferase [Streptomyces albus]